MKRLACIATIAILGTSALRMSALVEQKKPVEESKIEKTLASKNVDSAKVSNWVGDIKVFADSPDEVKVKAIRHAEGGTAAERHRWLTETSVQIEQQGSAILVKDIVPESLRKSLNHRNGHDSLQVHLNLDIHLPSRLALVVSNMAGDVRIEGTGGGLDLNTTAGNLVLAGLRCANKPVAVHHSAGDIEMDGQVGDLTLTNGAGGLKASELRVSGKVVDLHLGAGEVELAMLSLPTERLKVDVGTGEVHLRLPANAQARLSASTGVGNIESSGLQFSSSKRGGSSLGGSLKGDLNGGGPLLDIHTGIGEVHLASK